MGKIHLPLLLKFGRKQDMESLCEKGQIFMNKVKHYVELEKQEIERENGRADVLEGLENRYQANEVVIYIDDTPINDLVHTVDIHLDSNMEKYIYCMAVLPTDRIKAFKRGEVETLIPHELHKMGEYCTYIYPPNHFIELFKAAFMVEEFNLISYEDLDIINGKVGLFRKHINFKNQFEFRIVVSNPEKTEGPLIRDIGNLKNTFFSDCVRTEDLESILTDPTTVKVTRNSDSEILEEMSMIDLLVSAEYER